MKKSTTIIIILLAIAHITVAQDSVLTNLRHNLSVAKDDTTRVGTMLKFCYYYTDTKLDSSLIYGYKALELARKIKFQNGQFEALESLIIRQAALGNNTKALQLIFQAEKIANPGYQKATLILNKGAIYENSKDYRKALNLYGEAKKIFDSTNDSMWAPFAQVAMGKMYLGMHRPDSALYHCEAAYKNAMKYLIFRTKVKDNWVPQYILLQLGRVQDELGNTELALSYFRQTLANPVNTGEICECYLSIAQLYKRIGNQDSAIFYGARSLVSARESGLYNNIINASLFLSVIYEHKNLQQALLYSKNAISYKDSVHKMAESATQDTFADLDEKERQREIEDAKAQFKNRFQIYTFIGITFTLLIVATVLYRSSRLKQKAKQNIEKAYAELKSTQAQLIQSEKMASLGELTAGIAHEIQNPLNFVNNFSEVNRELLVELKDEMNNGNIDEANAIANDVIENSEKINHHGKRADSIVKGMLQHSHSSSSLKEPTNINALVDEYVRLSYHGFRAKDKDFNATMNTNFDESIGNVNIIPQDIGRVLLNLYNNAFYAVNEKQKAESLKQQAQGNSYKPTIFVSTKKINDYIEIHVTDNGNGIPQKIIDKIFQPFFTTKPTGQGTGLGLSLSYDIVKVHGGEIKVESKEGEGTDFIIQLPLV
jgi:two-component system NtrC family sensor kinase